MIETDTKATKAVITRPSVARALQAAGYDVKPVPSIWREDFTVWVYTLDATSAEIVRSCYEKIGKEPPRAIRDFFKSQEAQA